MEGCRALGYTRVSDAKAKIQGQGLSMKLSDEGKAHLEEEQHVPRPKDTVKSKKNLTLPGGSSMMLSSWHPRRASEQSSLSVRKLSWVKGDTRDLPVFCSHAW